MSKHFNNVYPADQNGHSEQDQTNWSSGEEQLEQAPMITAGYHQTSTREFLLQQHVQKQQAQLEALEKECETLKQQLANEKGEKQLEQIPTSEVDRHEKSTHEFLQQQHMQEQQEQQQKAQLEALDRECKALKQQLMAEQEKGGQEREAARAQQHHPQASYPTNRLPAAGHNEPTASVWQTRPKMLFQGISELFQALEMPQYIPLFKSQVLLGFVSDPMAALADCYYAGD